MGPKHFILREEEFWLLPERMIYYPSDKMLILADIHLGKTGHFRKSGIAVPQMVYKQDVQRLFAAIQLYHPQTVIIVGDMFHSKANKELNLFLKWRKDFAELEFQLIKGNHDILFAEFYEEAAVSVDNIIRKKCFSFIHDITDIDGKEENSYFFCGHIHPSICVKGISRQHVHLPCFYFTKNYAVLPAFSEFSGNCVINPKQDDQVFAILNNSILQVH